MSEIPQSAFQHVINGLSKIKHTPQNDHQLYSSAMQLLKNNFGTEDLGIVLIEALKSESPESVNNFLTQLEHSDIGVIAFGRSSSLSSALQAVIDLRGTKILNLVLEIILKSCTLSGDSSNAVVDQTGSLFEKVLRLIPSEDLTISGQACKLTESIIITSQTQQSLLAIMYSESCAYVSIEKNIFLRFANIWARILGRDDNLFNLCSTCGAAEAIVSLCRSHDDILVQIVAMELLIHFAKTSSGLQYLFSAGVIDWLVTVTSSEEDATLLGNQALRQLGDIFATSSSKNLISNKIWSAIDESIISRYMLSVRNYLDSRSEADRLTGDHNPPRVFLL